MYVVVFVLLLLMAYSGTLSCFGFRFIVWDGRLPNSINKIVGWKKSVTFRTMQIPKNLISLRRNKK